MTPSTRVPSATASGVPPLREMRSRQLLKVPAARVPPCSLTKLDDRFGGALAELAAVDIDAAHARVGGERNEVRLVLGDFAAAQAVLLLGQHDDRAAFGSFVGQAGELRGIGQFARR